MKHVTFRIQHVGLAALLALFPSSQVVAQKGKAPQEQAQPTVHESPYDLRGLTIEPGPNERHVLDTSLAIRLIAPARTTPTQPRMIAEWEPVQAALIRYPLGISVDAVKLIASELKTYVVCSSSSQSSARSAFQNGGVNMSNIVFVTAPSDTYWTRDYGPWSITNLENGQRVVRMLDMTYRPNGERPNDDRVPSVLATTINLPTYFSSTFVCQGGNVMTDSLHVGASTNRVQDENSNLSLSQIKQTGQTYMGFNPYYVMTDPAYPDDYIKHMDCWAKFISPNKVLVKRLPSSDSHYSKFEDAANTWANQTDVDGHPYQVIRVDGSWDSPYVNHVILNDRVLVPIITSETASADKTALDQIKAAYGSSYRVIGVKAASNLPWLGTDSIHCRVNSVPVFSGLFDQNTGLAFTNQPASQTVTAGSTVTFNVAVAGGTTPYTYQWYKNDTYISGVTGTTYTFTAQASDNNASIHVVVSDSSNPVKTATSSNATLTVTTQQVSVSISPTTATLTPGATKQFTATVSGSSSTSVTWSCVGGSISNTGLYTAPSTAGNYTVKATSVADTSKSASATVTVASNNGTTFNEVEANDSTSAANAVPDTATKIVGTIGTSTDKDYFKVNVGAGVTLKVDMTGPSGKDYDLYLFNSSGTQLAKSTTSTATESVTYKNTGSATVYTIQALGYNGATSTTSYNLALTKSSTPNTVSVTINPTSASIVVNTTKQFTATVSGSSNSSVTWTCTGGTVSNSGLYTAPSAVGNYTVKATSVADTSKSASATVTVSSNNGGSTYNEAEGNDSMAAANEVPDTATKIVATLGTSTDKDYFKVLVGAGKTLKVNMTGPSGKDYDLYLFNSSGTQLAKSTSSSATESVSYQNTGSATVYTIQVLGYNGATSTTPYNLALSR